jgi:hypothetical protein
MVAGFWGKLEYMQAFLLSAKRYTQGIYDLQSSGSKSDAGKPVEGSNPLPSA